MTPTSVRRSRTRSKQILTRQRVSSEYRDHLISDYLEGLDCPRALTSWLLYKYGEHHQLVSLTCEPQHYNSVETFRPAYAATKFLSKCVGLKTGIDLKRVAIESAEEAERANLITNQTIVAIREGHASDLRGSEIFRASQIVAKILGPVPEQWTFDPQSEPDAVIVDVERILLRKGKSSLRRLRELLPAKAEANRSFRDVGWSTGRTSSASGSYVTGYHKYRSRPDVTVKGRLAALRLLNGSPWWGASVLQTDAPVSVLPRALTIIGGNTLLTVPKSAKTDRVICFEPHMNIRAQLAVGSYLRSRLRKHGVNLDDQSINRRRALLGSRTGHLATIDLSSASDMIARELVWELLPIDWACLLDDLRSHNTLWPDGSWRKCEKFSSMGNGFTFELESLIFYALASAVTGNVSVYGDDIVVPSESFSQVARLLTACGFKLNAKKSFSSGYFRESCGGDYFGGVDCTPVFLRSLPKTIEDVVKLHNQVRRFASVYQDRKWALLMRKWRTIFPCHVGPQGYGDGHYHVNWDEGSFSLTPGGHESWRYRTRVPYLDRSDEFELAPSLCASLGPKGTLNLRHSALKRRIRYKDIWGQCQFDWPDILWID